MNTNTGKCSTLFGTLSVVLFLACASFVVSSCIKDSDVDLLNSKTTSTNEASGRASSIEAPTIDNADELNPTNNGKRNILFTKFTGQTCPHCPWLTYFCNTFREKNPELAGNFYAASLHCILEHSYTLSSRASEYYYSTINKSSIPESAMNNVYKSWYHDHKVDSLINTKPYVQSAVLAEKESNKMAKISYRSELLNNYDDFDGSNVRVIFWLIEKDVVTWQNTYNGIIKDYCNKRLFRKALNYYTGDNYELGSTFETTISIAKSDKDSYFTEVDYKNCQVLAIVRDADDNRYIDAVICDLEEDTTSTGITKITI